MSLALVSLLIEHVNQEGVEITTTIVDVRALFIPVIIFSTFLIRILVRVVVKFLSHDLDTCYHMTLSIFGWSTDSTSFTLAVRVLL